MSANSKRWSHEPRRDLGWVTWIVAPVALGIAAALAAITVARSLAKEPEETAQPAAPAAANTTAGAQAASPTRQPLNGKELFTREWQPRDPRAHGGDGLGPLFNDTSCVACHNQGGVGGGGSKGRNVNIVTAHRVVAANPSGPGSAPGAGGAPGPGTFAAAGTTSFVLHHSGTDGEFAKWRQTLVQSGAGHRTGRGWVRDGWRRVWPGRLRSGN